MTGEPGVKLHLDINVIDVTDCTHVVDTFVELWGANSTGVYTGVQSVVNGDGSASSLSSNALRGIQPTDANGTARFITVVPGHYVARTNHLHSKNHSRLASLSLFTDGSSHHSPGRKTPSQQHHRRRRNPSRRSVLH